MGDEDFIPFSEQLKIQRAEGHADGLAKGLAGIVHMGREFGLSDEEIVNRIMKELEVDEETAREQLKNLWSSSRLASESE